MKNRNIFSPFCSPHRCYTCPFRNRQQESQKLPIPWECFHQKEKRSSWIYRAGRQQSLSPCTVGETQMQRWSEAQTKKHHFLHVCIKTHLITKGVSANSDGLCPARNKPGNVLANDWLSEDGASQNVPDGSIGALPHFLQTKLYSRKTHMMAVFKHK